LAYLSDRLDAAAASPSSSAALLDGDVALQLVTVSLVYRVCRAQPSERGRFIRAVYSLLSSPSSSPAVRYEAAGTLVTLSTAPTAVRAAARAYVDLAARETDDNNVKLIVLDRLVALREEGGEGVEKVMKEMVMDVLRVLAAPDLEVRRKTLNLGT
jgi:coatomer subunit beta